MDHSVWQPYPERRYCLGDFKNLVNAHLHVKSSDDPLEFLVHLVGDKADADMGLDAFLREVEHRTHLKRALADAEDMPQILCDIPFVTVVHTTDDIAHLVGTPLKLRAGKDLADDNLQSPEPACTYRPILPTPISRS